MPTNHEMHPWGTDPSPEMLERFKRDDVTPLIARLNDTIAEQSRELAALRAENERLRRDSERLEWLAQQFVSVRIPLRYGSQHCFDHYAEPDECEEIDVEATDNLRRSIDQSSQSLEPTK